MPGLRDIGPLKVTLTINGKKIDFHGLTVADVFELHERFEGVRVLIEGGGAALAARLRDTPALIREIPNALYAAVAMSTGDRNDKKAEAIVARLPLSVQVAMVNAVVKSTFHEGIGPFVRAIEGITSVVTASPAPTPEKAESASAKPSPAPSLAALQVDLPSERLGRLHPVN